MSGGALDGIAVVDVAGTVATGYCAKVFADYGAEVVNLEPPEGFETRRLAPFMPQSNSANDDAQSAMHAYLSTNKKSVTDSAASARLVAAADLVLDDGVSRCDVDSITGVRSSVSWYGRGGPFEDDVGSDGQIFAQNGMLRGIGRVEGPPLIPTGYQAQVVGGMTAFIGSMTQVLAGELGNRGEPVHLETSIFESCLCFTDVGVVGAYTSGLYAPRMGINRYPPTYPLGVFPCKDGWIGVTVLTPSQWHSFCELLGMDDLAHVDLFQAAIGRLQGLEVIEPLLREKLLTFSAEDLFYRAQNARIPLARVPTMEELFEVDQFVERTAFSEAVLPQGAAVKVPSVPFRLFDTPPHFGGPVAGLGQHNEEVSP